MCVTRRDAAEPLGGNRVVVSGAGPADSWSAEPEAVRREELAASTKRRHGRRRGRHQQHRMTGRQRAAGPDEAAQQDAWSKPGRAKGALLPCGVRGS